MGVAVGLKPESAYYESLHETPLIANTIARMKLHEINSVISDTAEYGCYLYSQACEPLLKDFMAKVDVDVIGKKYSGATTASTTASSTRSTRPSARTRWRSSARSCE